MAPKYVLSIDQGTTSSRVILFNHAGAPVATSQKEHKQIFPHSGWVEHDPEEIWQRVKECITDAMARAGALASDIASVGITNQRETVVVWNKDTGAALCNALVWQDQRGAGACAELAKALAKSGGADALRPKTGLPIVPYFTASKLAWVLENVPGARAAAEAGTAIAGTIDSFLTYRLTGGGSGSRGSAGSKGAHVTDVTNASRTLLFNIHTMAWDDELCALWKVPRGMLPRVLPSSSNFGSCDGAVVPELAGVRIAGILGDQQAALFGQACFTPGDAKNTYGTGCFLLMNTGPVPVDSSHGLLCTVGYQVGSKILADGTVTEPQPPVYALEGSVAVAGAAVNWLRDNVKLIDSAREIESLASSVPDNGDCYFVPAFNGLFAPHWRSDARGVLVGLSGGTSRGHIARATLEAVAFQSRELLEAMAKDARHVLDRAVVKSLDLKVDGGMTPNALLMQFQADITGRRVVRPVVAETTALGAAYAAGLATGFWTDLEQLKQQWQVDMTFSPAMPQSTVRALCHNWDRAVTRTLGWAKAAQAVPHAEELLPPAPRGEATTATTAARSGSSSSSSRDDWFWFGLRIYALTGAAMAIVGAALLYPRRW